jgi:hypothetical protein
VLHWNYVFVNPSYWAASFIKELSAKKLIEGYPDGKFRPDRVVTRAEFAKMMTLAAGLKAEKVEHSPYSDVQPSDWDSPLRRRCHWYQQRKMIYVIWLMQDFKESTEYLMCCAKGH